MAAGPGRVDVVVPNALPYPRDPDAPEFKQIVERLHAILTHTILPEAAAGIGGKIVTKIDESRRHIAPVSLPYVTPAEVLGLMALLGDAPTDVFDLAERFGKEFGSVVNVVKAAEMLDFVQTPQHDVLLTPLGRTLVAGSTAEQKRLVKEQLLKLKIFELLVRLIKVQEDQHLPVEDLLHELQVALPHEKPRPLLRTLLSWGRYAEIISYDQRRHILRLYEARGSTPKPKAPVPPAPPTPPPPAPNESASPPAAPPAAPSGS
jgi:NitT/TauT family transport system ATP-binding protein